MTATLVTGGAGFIGTNLVQLLAAETDWPIVVFDALTYAGDLTGIGPLIESGRIHFERGDICDSERVTEVLNRYQITRVFHLAAESHVDRSISAATPFVTTNVLGTQVMLDACRVRFDEADESCLFVHVSTDEVFGDLDANDEPFSLASPYSPNSPYAATKAASDHLCRAWHRTYDLPAVVTNCSNNFGPWQFPEKLIPLMILNAMEERGLPVYGDGQQIRDWLHVEDHASALLCVARHGEAGKTYLIGGDHERSNLSLVHDIADKVDAQLHRPDGTSRKLIRHVADRPGHDRRYAIDASSVRGLGWHPIRSLDSSLTDVIAWYTEHADWCERIRSGEYQRWYTEHYLSSERTMPSAQGGK